MPGCSPGQAQANWYLAYGVLLKAKDTMSDLMLRVFVTDPQVITEKAGKVLDLETNLRAT